MFRMHLTVALTATFLTVGLFPIRAQESQPLKRFVDREVVNEKPSFFIRVEVNNPDHVYYRGEELVVKMIAEKDCYVHIINIDSKGDAYCLFPNVRDKDNALKAGVERQLAGLVPGDPYGDEVICVIASETQKQLFANVDVTAGPSRSTPLSDQDITNMAKRLTKGPGKIKRFVDKVVEHRIGVRTVDSPRPGGPPPDGPQDQIPVQGAQRYAVCIGVSDYQDPEIPDLRLSENDARHMADAIRDYCGVPQANIRTLFGPQATLAAIRRVIFEDLKSTTKPGDTVIIYFSGHGGKCADTDGDESAANGGDGMDEYIVPYDGKLSDAENTMLIDDTFGRWLNELQGRKVLVILDNCYSGGQAKALKGPASSKAKAGKGLAAPAGARPGLGVQGRPGLSRPGNGDFQGEINRVRNLRFKNGKDIGGSVVLLAASDAGEIAFEMPDERGSVLTYFLIESLKGAPSGYTAETAYGQIKKSVMDYVRDTFQTTQTPVLTGQSPGLLIHP